MFFVPPNKSHISLRLLFKPHRSHQRSTTIMIAPWLSAISSHFILRFLRWPVRDDWNHCASDNWNLLNSKPTWKKTCVFWSKNHKLHFWPLFYWRGSWSLGACGELYTPAGRWAPTMGKWWSMTGSWGTLYIFRHTLWNIIVLPSGYLT